jgi:hypothetical protein
VPIKLIERIAGLAGEAARSLTELLNAHASSINELEKLKMRVTSLFTSSVVASEGTIVRVRGGLSVTLPRARTNNQGRQIHVHIESDGEVSIVANQSLVNGQARFLTTGIGLRIFESNGDTGWFTNELGAGNVLELAANTTTVINTTTGLDPIPPQRVLGNDSAVNAVPVATTVHQELDWIGGAQSWLFDGVDDSISMGDHLNFSNATPFSFGCWFRTTKLNAFQLISRLAPVTARGWQVFMSGGQVFAQLLNDVTTTNLIQKGTTATFNNGALHHVMVTYDGSGLNTGIIIYIDGVAVAQTTSGAVLAGTIVAPGTLTISTGSWLDLLQHASVWSKKLSAAEALQTYGAGTPPVLTALSFAANLVGWWKVDGTDSTAAGGVIDYSISANHGTALNGLGVGGDPAIGSLPVRGATLWQALPPGVAGQVLTSVGTASIPEYRSLPSSLGAPGLDGQDGLEGPPGAPGARGDTGAAGPPGPQGDTGDDGADGPPGPPGAAGASGATGATGAAGAAGPPGADGQDGADGSQGPPGPAGADGAAGASGAAGPSGAQGPPGLDGQDGGDGSPGPAGPAGIDGATGATGATGPQGPPGLDGADGQDGAPGPPGPTGATGPAGGGGSGAIAVAVAVNLGTTPLWSGSFDVTGLAGLTLNDPVLVSTGVSTSNPTESEEQIAASGIAISTTAFRVYWESLNGPVYGTRTFNYLTATGVTVATGAVAVEDDNASVLAAATILNFAGSLSAVNAGSGQADIEYAGTTNSIDVAGATGNLGTVDVSTLKCGGSLNYTAHAANFSIEGFTARSEGFWFVLVTANTSSFTTTLFHEDATASTTDRMRLGGNVDAAATGISALIYYKQSRWRVVENAPARILQISYADGPDASVSIPPPTGSTWFEMECQGGGAGGGGADADGIGESCAGSGGGAGAWFRHRRAITAGNITGSIGGGGAGGNNAGGAAVAGDPTAYSYDGTGHSAGGGSPGTSSTVGADQNGQMLLTLGGSGGVPDPATLEHSDGGPGHNGIMFASSTLANAAACGGAGGASQKGGGGRGGVANGAGATSSGEAGRALGSGGGGGARTSTGAASTGATGAPGLQGYMKVTFWCGPVPTDATIT